MKMRLLILVPMAALLMVGCSQFNTFKASQTGDGEMGVLPPTLSAELEIRSANQLFTADVQQILDELPQCDELEDFAIIECLAIMDSFERDEILQNDGQPSFGWSTIIDDVLGANGRRVDATIYDDTEMGYAPESIIENDDDQRRALYFTGRRGASVHSIYLIAQPMDLTEFNTLMIGFQFTGMDLETWSWDGESGPENIRLEACLATLDECGIGDQVNRNGLNSDNWSVVYQSPDNIGEGLNGHNHTADDISEGFADVNIAVLPEEVRSNFVFRIAVTLDEGFREYNRNDRPVVSSNLIDGVMLDNVIVLASKREVVDP